MKLNFLLCCFFVSIKIFSQDFKKVDQIISTYPKKFNAVEKLAERINNDFKNDLDKVRATYSWLALNISYDSFKDNFDISNRTIVYFNSYDKEYQIKKRRLNKINKLLKTSKGVCLDYSYVFKELCDKLEVESVIITGYSKTDFNDIGNLKGYKNHSWNAVNIDNEWRLVDVTWGSVYSTKKRIDSYYCFTEPSELIKTHLPIKSKWQLIIKKVTKVEFFNSPLFYPNYFIDKIKIENIGEGQIESSNNRIKIIFDSIPKNKKLYYAISGENIAKPVKVNRGNKGNYIASIKFKEDKKSQITIYSNSKPVIGFKIK